MTYSEAIKQRILTLCSQKDITVNKLARLAGLTPSSVQSIVDGQSKNPKLKTLHKIAFGFDMTLSQFLDFPELNDALRDDE